MTTIDTDEMMARRLPLAGTFNVRDIGGYPTVDGRVIARRRILRGDAIHRVDDEGRALLSDYPVRTSLDLREEEERTAAPDQLGAGVDLVSIPVFTYQIPEGDVGLDRASLTSLGDVYDFVIAERGAALAAVLAQLARPGTLPAIVHCTGGKDRTGIVIALLLSVLGVPDEIVAQDFSATSMFLNDEFFAALTQRAADAGEDVATFATLLTCEPELILGVLDAVRASHGDVRSYLLDHGLSDEELDVLRYELVDDHEGASSADLQTTAYEGDDDV